jgi:hypothetical protein
MKIVWKMIAVFVSKIDVIFNYRANISSILNVLACG